MPDPDAIAARFEYTFAGIRDTRMREVPILNESMPVKAVGFREWGAYWLGVLITPWFMNLVLSPRAEGARAWPELRVTDTVRHSFPAGEYTFLVGEEEGIGRYQMCSLFSPMFEFEDAAAAVMTAEAVLVALFEAEAGEAGDEERLAPPRLPGKASIASEQASPKAVSRRAFLIGLSSGEKDTG